MTIQCPSCNSDDVTNLSFDSNDFICNDCGENFQADNGIDLDEDSESQEDENEGGFIDLDPKTALDLSKQLRENTEKQK